MSQADSYDPAALLEQAGWVRRLAGRLLGDGAAADDVTQETLVVALESASSGDSSQRSWLAGVVRNLVRARVRSDANRSQREAEARPHLPSPSAADVVARGEGFRLLVQAVLELPEPYRSTLLMRYFEGLSTVEIAEKSGASRAAIRTRHSRGLSLLREGIDRRHGGEARTWLAALASPAFPRSIATPTLPVATVGGALLMSTKAILVGATLALVLGGLWWRTQSVPAAAVEVTETEGAAAPESRDAEPELAESAPRVPREEPLETPEPATGFVHPPMPYSHAFLARSVHVRGRVIDLSQQPVGGVSISLLTGAGETEVMGTSGEDGSFEITEAGTHGMLEASNEVYAPVLNANFFSVPKETSDSDLATVTLVVAARGEFEGLVVDGDGGPIAEAEVAVELPPDFRVRFDVALDMCISAVVEVASGADGHFALEAGCVPGSRLIARKAGHPRGEIELPTRSAHDLRLVLSSSEHSSLSGRVVDAQARPVVGARLAFGWQATQSNEEGRFEFDLGGEPVGGWDPEELVALHPDFLPVRVAEASQAGGEWGEPVTVELSQLPYSISGKVVRFDGKPVDGAELYLLNPMFFGAAQQGDSFGTADMEQLLNGNTRHSAPLATTEADGSFVVNGLLPREYVLYVIEPETLARATSTPIRAPATGVTVELESTVLTPVAGRVVDKHGEAMPDMFLTVNVRRVVDRQGLPFGGGFPEFFYTPHQARTDAEGRFAFAEMDPTDVQLQIHLPGVVDVFHYDLATAEPPLEEMEIVAYRRCHFLVDLAGRQDFADSFQLLDEQGEPVDIVFSRGDRTMHRSEAELQDGRSETLSASERANTLVLYKAGEIVQSLPIELTPEETARVGL